VCDSAATRPSSQMTLGKLFLWCHKAETLAMPASSMSRWRKNNTILQLLQVMFKLHKFSYFYWMIIDKTILLTWTRPRFQFLISVKLPRRCISWQRQRCRIDAFYATHAKHGLLEHGDMAVRQWHSFTPWRYIERCCEHCHAELRSRLCRRLLRGTHTRCPGALRWTCRGHTVRCEMVDGCPKPYPSLSSRTKVADGLK